MHRIIALLLGALLPLSFAPFGFWFLCFPALAGLYYLLQNKAPKQAFITGWFFALPYFVLGVSWIYNSLHDFGAALPAVAALMTLVLVLVLTLFPAAACALHARLRSGRAMLDAALFASSWCLFELLRGWLFGGFPWLLLGYSQTDSIFRAFASYVGVYGISWLVVLFSALLTLALCKQFEGQARDRRSRLLVLIPLLALPLSGWALLSVEFSEPRANTIRFRLVQGNIPQELKFSEERLVNSLQTYISLSRENAEGVDIVVWPETAIPALFSRVDGVIGPFAETMLEKGTEVLSGGFHRDGDDVYNAFRQLGGEKALYTKRHLVPFGEFMPFRWLLDFVSRFIIIPMSDLSKGTGVAHLLDIKGEKLGLSICYEDVFGEEMAASFPGATVLVNVSNDAWFGERVAPFQHEQIARMRAIEFERPLMRVTNTGITSAINYRGLVRQSIAHGESDYIDVDVVPRTGSTPYTRLKNYPVWLVSLLVILSLSIMLKIRQRSIAQ